MSLVECSLEFNAESYKFFLVKATPGESWLSALRNKVDTLLPADDVQLNAVQDYVFEVYDEDFNEYVILDEMSELKSPAQLRCIKNTDETHDAFLYVKSGIHNGNVDLKLLNGIMECACIFQEYDDPWDLFKEITEIEMDSNQCKERFHELTDAYLRDLSTTDPFKCVEILRSKIFHIFHFKLDFILQNMYSNYKEVVKEKEIFNLRVAEAQDILSKASTNNTTTPSSLLLVNNEPISHDCENLNSSLVEEAEKDERHSKDSLGDEDPAPNGSLNTFNCDSDALDCKRDLSMLSAICKKFPCLTEVKTPIAKTVFWNEVADLANIGFGPDECEERFKHLGQKYLDMLNGKKEVSRVDILDKWILFDVFHSQLSLLVQHSFPECGDLIKKKVLFDMRTIEAQSLVLDVVLENQMITPDTEFWKTVEEAVQVVYPHLEKCWIQNMLNSMKEKYVQLLKKVKTTEEAQKEWPLFSKFHKNLQFSSVFKPQAAAALETLARKWGNRSGSEHSCGGSSLSNPLADEASAEVSQSVEPKEVTKLIQMNSMFDEKSKPFRRSSDFHGCIVDVLLQLPPYFNSRSEMWKYITLEVNKSYPTATVADVRAAFSTMKKEYFDILKECLSFESTLDKWPLFAKFRKVPLFRLCYPKSLKNLPTLLTKWEKAQSASPIIVEEIKSTPRFDFFLQHRDLLFSEYFTRLLIDTILLLHNTSANRKDFWCKCIRQIKSKFPDLEAKEIHLRVNTLRIQYLKTLSQHLTFKKSVKRFSHFDKFHLVNWHLLYTESVAKECDTLRREWESFQTKEPDAPKINPMSVLDVSGTPPTCAEKHKKRTKKSKNSGIAALPVNLMDSSKSTISKTFTKPNDTPAPNVLVGKIEHQRTPETPVVFVSDDLLATHASLGQRLGRLIMKPCIAKIGVTVVHLLSTDNHDMSEVNDNLDGKKELEFENNVITKHNALALFTPKTLCELPNNNIAAIPRRFTDADFIYVFHVAVALHPDETSNNEKLLQTLVLLYKKSHISQFM